MQDTIERQITIRAPRERVYRAITDPTQIVKWFPDAIEGNLEAGSSPIFTFEGHGRNQIYVVAADPFDYFAYRWVPGSAHVVGDVLAQPNTLVEFRISEANGVSTVTLLESGFASLPADLAEKAICDNSGGWDYMLNRLEQHFA